MTTSTDVLPGQSIAAGGLAGLGVAGWLGTMSPRTARAYAGDLRQVTACRAGRDIDPGDPVNLMWPRVDGSGWLLRRA